MDCSKVRELASEYVEGTLPAALHRAVRAHADTCPACAADLSALQTLWTQFDTLPAVEPPPFFHENVMTAIEREARTPRVGAAAWRALWPRLGKVALSTLATGGALAAVASLLLLPQPDGPDTQKSGFPRVGNILPGTAYQETAVAPPRLQIARTATVDPQYGPACKFTLWLEEASRGTARLQMLSDASLAPQGDAFRFVLTSEQPQALVVPFAAVKGDTINLSVSWTANGERHTKYLFVPLPKETAPAEVRQSFGLAPASLPAAAREIAVRYQRPVTLEDVPPLDKIVVAARQETATKALRRALEGRGVRVSLSGAGILIEPDEAGIPASATP